jgi:hypothetical protein
MRQPTDEAALRQWLTERWRAGCDKAGLRVPSRKRAVKLSNPGESAAEYVLGITTEVVRADLKAARAAKNFAPFQLLDQEGTSLEPWARQRWREYERAVHGRHAVAYSRGLRRLLRTLPVVDLVEDGRDYEGDADPAAVFFSPREWQTLRRSPVGLANLLALLDAGRPDRVAALLAGLRTDVDTA